MLEAVRSYIASAIYVHVLQGRYEDIAKTNDLWNNVSKGKAQAVKGGASYILMSQVLEKFQLTVSSLGQNRRAERLHDLLYSNGLSGQLIFGRALE